MNREINKPNDIFVSTILNPSATSSDLILNGINSSNTLFLSPDEYAKTDFVKKQFTDENGTFNNELFNKAYLAAAVKYEELASIKLMKDLHKYAEYDKDDVFAPIDGVKKIEQPFVISRIKNPWQSTKSLVHLNKVAESGKTYRELAQQRPLYDTKSGKFLDYTPEDIGLFKGLFHTPMAYAKYTEDVEEFDPSLGRVVLHKKGELKLSPDGNFYVETVLGTEGYDREFVSIGDILTKENSWLNPVAFWENDDKHKSVTGVVFQTAATIAPYLLFGDAWGAVAATVQLAKAAPTLAKAVEGLFVPEGETEFTKAMNYWENYMKRYDRSMSDDSLNKMFSLEMAGQLVGDIFGQLYQMRAAAGLSAYAKRDWTKAQNAAVAKFNRLYAQKVQEAAHANKLGSLTKEDIFKQMAELSPEIKRLINLTTKLSLSLSLGYMAITSATDVYQDAIRGGYDRRVAGSAALASILGLYLLMSNNKLRTWFLDSAVGYKEDITRGMIRDALKPYIDDIYKALKALPSGASQALKLGVLQKALRGTKTGLGKAWDLITTGAGDFWGKASIEAIEEVTEEALFDLTKGVTDALNYFGLLGESNKMGSFGGWDNVFSQQGAARYLQSALGGFVGGGLFHVQLNIILPWMTGQAVNPETKKDLIQLLQQGHYNEIVDGIAKLAEVDADVAAAEWLVGDQIIRGSANGETMTRGLALAKSLKSYVDYLQAVLSSKNLDNMTSDDLINKTVRDMQVREFLTSSGVHNLMISDFNENTAKIVSLLEKIDRIKDNESLTEKRKALEAELKEYIDRVNKMINGEAAAEYVQMSLIYAISDINQNLSPISKYNWTLANYGQSYSSLPDTGVGLTKAFVDAEYKKFSESTDKKEYLRQMMNGYNHINGIVSSPLKTYIESYKNIRSSAWRKVFSLMYTGLSAEEKAMYFDLLLRVHNTTKTAATSGLSLLDIIMPDVNDIYELILKPYGDANLQRVKKLAKIIGLSTEEYLRKLAEALAGVMSILPVETWNAQSINAALIRSNLGFMGPVVLKIMSDYKVTELTPEIVAKWLSENDMGLDPAIDVTGKDPIKMLAVGTRPLLLNIVENFSALTLDKYIQQEETLDAEILHYLKERIANDLCSIEGKSALETSIYNSKWAEAADVDRVTLSSSIWNNITNIIQSELNKFTPLEQIAELIVNSETGLLKFLISSDRAMEEEYNDNPAYGEELKQVVLTWLNSAESAKLYTDALGKPSHMNPLFDILRTTDFEMNEGQNMSVFNIIQEESNNLRNIADINEFLKMPDAVERIDSALSVISTIQAVVAGMVESDLEFGGNPFGYNTQLNAHKDLLEGLEGTFETITMEDAHLLNVDLEMLKQKLLFVKELSAKNTDSKKQDDLKAQQKFADLAIEQIKLNASKLTFRGVSIFTDDDLAVLDDATIPIPVRLGRVEHNAHLKVLEILEKMDVKDFAKELFNILGIDRKAFLDQQMVSAGISKDTKALTQFDMLNYFVSIFSTDSNKFYYAYDKILAQPEYDKVPFFVQELAARLAYSFLWDLIGLHDAMVDALYDGVERNAQYPMKASSFIFIDGVTGAGKTTVAAMLALADSDLSKKVGIIGPNKNLASKLHKALKEPSGGQIWSKELLFKQFLSDEVWAKLQADLSSDKEDDLNLIEQIKTSEGNWWSLKDLKDDDLERLFKKRVKLPKLLIIDEATHFNAVELQLLDKVATLHGIKILTLGDDLLDGASLKKDPDSNIRDVFRWAPPKIKLSNRPANINKKETIDVLSTILSEYKTAEKLVKNSDEQEELDKKFKERFKRFTTTLKYWESEDELRGDKLVKEITVEDVNRLARNAKKTGGKVGIITKLDADGKPVTTGGFNILTIIEASELKEGDYVYYSPDKIHPNAAQGAEEDFVIVNLDEVSTTLDKALTKIYTMLTRSIHGSLLKVPESTIKSLNLKPLLTSRPGEYRMPGLDLRKNIHAVKLTEILQILNGWVPAGKAPEAEPEAAAAPESTGSESTEPEIPVISAAHLDPSKVTAVMAADVEDKPKTRPTGEAVPGISSYTFYTDLSMIEDGGQYRNTTKSPFNASGLLRENAVLTKTQARGYSKLKNILSLYPDIKGPELISLIGRFNQDTVNEIAEFIKVVFNLDSSASEETIIRAFVNGLTIDANDYIVAKKFDPSNNSPIFKQGFDASKLLSEGEPLIMPARKISITIGGVTKSTYVTIGAFPKATTAEYKRFGDKVTNDLADKDYVVYSTKQRFKLLGQKLGRLVKHDKKSSFLTLADLLLYGVNVKLFGLITSNLDAKTSKYHFIEFAKNYLDNVESFVLNKEGIFTKAGCYYAILGFDSSSPNPATDHLVFLTLDQVLLMEAMKVVTSTSSSFEDKLSILHEFSYSLLLLKVFDDRKLFSDTNKHIIKEYFVELKSHLETLNTSGHYTSAINILGSFINQDRFNRDNVENYLKKTTGIGAYFFGKFARISGDKIQIYGPGTSGIAIDNFTYTGPLFKNVRPVDRANTNGVCAVSTEHVFENLGLLNNYYEPAKLFIPLEVLDTAELVTEETTVEPKSDSAEKPMEKIESMADRIMGELTEVSDSILSNDEIFQEELIDLSWNWTITGAEEQGDDLLVTVEHEETEDTKTIPLSLIKLQLYNADGALMDPQTFLEEIYKRFPMAKNLDLYITDLHRECVLTSSAFVGYTNELGEQEIIGYMYLDVNPITGNATWDFDEDIDLFFSERTKEDELEGIKETKGDESMPNEAMENSKEVKMEIESAIQEQLEENYLDQPSDLSNLEFYKAVVNYLDPTTLDSVTITGEDGKAYLTISDSGLDRNPNLKAFLDQNKDIICKI